MRPVRLPGAVTRSKYGAKPVVLDGYRFDSQAECRRYAELVIQVGLGEISELQVHPEFPLRVRGVGGLTTTIGKYVGDFLYITRAPRAMVVEDVKGVKTALYRWKKKHMAAEYGIEIQEIGRERR